MKEITHRQMRNESADVLEHPLRVPDRFHFPGNPMITRAELPGKWASWRRFWGETTDS